MGPLESVNDGVDADASSNDGSGTGGVVGLVLLERNMPVNFLNMDFFARGVC
jgi:hypothetical protein